MAQTSRPAEAETEPTQTQDDLGDFITLDAGVNLTTQYTTGRSFSLIRIFSDSTFNYWPPNQWKIGQISSKNNF